MNCDGKCYLAQKLKQSEENKREHRPYLQGTESFEFIPTSDQELNKMFGTIIPGIFPYRELTFSLEIHDIFHPPKV